MTFAGWSGNVRHCDGIHADPRCTPHVAYVAGVFVCQLERGLRSAAGDCAAVSLLDFWTNNTSYRLSDQASQRQQCHRVADDVILNNVIGFDVKAWDPDVGVYVDLGYTPTDRWPFFRTRTVRWIG